MFINNKTHEALMTKTIPVVTPLTITALFSMVGYEIPDDDTLIPSFHQPMT
jgi:hypothetical protein